MADLTSGLDDISEELGDAYDEAISPKKIVRSTTNKIWLTLRAFSKGLYGLYQVVLSLSYRFDPMYCSEEELASTMRIVGTSRIPAKASLVTVFVQNTSTTDPITLQAGRYLFISQYSITFAMTLTVPVTIAVGAGKYYDFSSVSGDAPLVGEYVVSAGSGVTVTRDDNVAIDENLVWFTEDNSGKLGKVEETLYEARQRLLSTDEREDQLVELQAEIKKLPNIHECNIIFNNTYEMKSVDYYVEDVQVQIRPQEFILLITGSPTDDLAELVVKKTPFLTHEVFADHVVRYINSVYVNGYIPIFWAPHLSIYYQLVITYQFNSSKMLTSVIEKEFNTLLLPLEYTSVHSDIVKISDIFNVLSEMDLDTSVSILSIVMKDEDGVSINYLSVPKTRLPKLLTVSYTPVDTAV